MRAGVRYILPRELWLSLSVFLTVGWFFPEGTSALEKTERVAILKSANIAPYNQAIQAFKNNLAIKESLLHEYLLEGELGEKSDIVPKILGSRADVVLAVGLKATLMAKIEIREIPVIFCMVLNPKRYNLEAPNLKGISLAIPLRDQLLLLQTVVPTVSRVGVLYDPEKSGPLVKNGEAQVHELGIELVGQKVSSQKELPAALREILPRIHALWLFPDSTVLTEDSFEYLLKVSLEKRVPVMGFSTGLVQKGALLGTYINYDDIGEQAAGLAKKVLKGQSLNDKNLLTPTQYRKAINLNTAHFLGLSISPKVLKEFDQRF